MSKRVTDLIAHFWSKVRQCEHGTACQFCCWEWQAGRFTAGYGCFAIRKKAMHAHRFCYEIIYGRILPGFFVCHTCDNPPCVNPAHLWVGIHRHNMHDARDKGRLASGDRHWSRLYPERRRRGDDHWAAVHQDWRVRGEAHGCAKLTTAHVLDIRRAVLQGISKRSLALHYGVTHKTIRDIVLRKTWKHVEEQG